MQVFSVTVASVKKIHGGKRRDQQEKSLPDPREMGPPYKEKIIFNDEKLVPTACLSILPALRQPRQWKHVGSVNGPVIVTAGVGGCLSSEDFRSHK